MPSGIYLRNAKWCKLHRGPKSPWKLAIISSNGFVHSKESRARQAATMKAANSVGPKHWAWKGTPRGGRGYARKLIPIIKSCSRCGSTKRLERHHKDSNPLNNKLSNIQVLCIICHNIVDGRTKRFVERHRNNYKKIPRLNGRFCKNTQARVRFKGEKEE